MGFNMIQPIIIIKSIGLLHKFLIWDFEYDYLV